MPPRAPTAYFIFAGEVRDAVREEIAATNGGKASVALVGKAVGERWKALTDEQKQHYKDTAAEKARELKEQVAAAAADGAADEEGAGAPSSSGPVLPPFGLPTSLVKKIATMDPEVDRMGADAVRALAKATTLFVQALAAKALATAAGQKRKNFKFSDIETAAKRDRRLVDVGLPELFEKDAAFAEVRDRAAEEGERKARGGKKGAGEAEGEGAGADGGPPRKKQARPLTDFFGGAAAAKSAGDEDAPVEEDAAAGAAGEELAAAGSDGDAETD